MTCPLCQRAIEPGQTIVPLMRAHSEEQATAGAHWDCLVAGLDVGSAARWCACGRGQAFRRIAEGEDGVYVPDPIVSCCVEGRWKVPIAKGPGSVAHQHADTQKAPTVAFDPRPTRAVTTVVMTPGLERMIREGEDDGS